MGICSNFSSFKCFMNSPITKSMLTSPLLQLHMELAISLLNNMRSVKHSISMLPHLEVCEVVEGATILGTYTVLVKSQHKVNN